MSPCQLHLDCTHCEDLVCVKGDEEKTRLLRLSLDEARKLLQKAEEAVSENYVGGDRWLIHHQSTVERLSQLCSIMDDPKVPPRTIVQLAPPSGQSQIGRKRKENLLPSRAGGTSPGLFVDLIAEARS